MIDFHGFMTPTRSSLFQVMGSVIREKSDFVELVPVFLRALASGFRLLALLNTKSCSLLVASIALG